MEIKTDDGKRCSVIYKNGDMEAFIKLEKPPVGVEYTREDIEEYLSANNVKVGIKESRIAAILKKKIFGREVIIAEGNPAKDGQDGYFEYKFDAVPKSKKPEIRADGTVDYTSMNVIKCVKEGDILAIYHPSVKGEAGMTIKGVVVKPRPARDLPPYALNGCSYNPATLTYVAERSGRIELTKNKMSILEVQEYVQDIDSVYGNVDFMGDVIIHGNVKPGVTIRAMKSITIDGVLEGANLIAGEDIVVKGGILGGGTSKISCGGDMLADFVEYTTISVKGSISANSLLDCNVMAVGSITATGKTGAIVGGKTYGMRGVECSYAGNDANIRTTISAGISSSLQKEKTLNERKIKMLIEKIEDLKNQSYEIERLARLGTVTEVMLRQRKALEDEIAAKEKELQTTKEALAELIQNMEGTEDAHIVISDTLYAGCLIQLGSQQMMITDNKRQVEFMFDRNDQLVARPVVNY
ncbi:MAG: DUF342 domain-containing protein [Lachnospiraceae bacterium]|nr:DUF342 domain-containing protein [Lachnospiraceae bacterium]MBO6214867.1 DUF342 domain-containing protein [Lachnospiraceae bacterium]